MGQTTDAELLAACMRGERTAFGTLIERYQGVVCAVSYSRTRNAALAEDVAQDTFLAAWPRLGQVRDPARLGGWLCGIARNLARKARRRRDREVAHDDVTAADLVAVDDPFTAVSDAEAERIVREALGRVPETYRDVLVLYYREGRSAEEVARLLDLSVPATLQRLARGRAALSRGLDGLVERSLSRPSRVPNLAAFVLASLPVVVPSRVEAATRSHGGSMLKLSLAALALVGAGTTAALLARDDSGGGTSTAAPHVSSPSAAPSTPAGAPMAAPRPAAPGSVRPGQTPALPPAAASDAPRLDRTKLAALGLDRGPSRGAADAPVTIVMFTDPACTYCGRAYGTIDQLLDDHPANVRLVIKQLPVKTQSGLLAEASYAAEAQGKFWELHDLMYAYEDDLSRETVAVLAKQAGLDVAAFERDVDGHAHARAVQADKDAAKEAGVRATPTFLVNGRRVEGAVPIEQLQAEIDAALADAT